MAEILSLKEVSAELGTPVATLRWWRATGAGPKSFKLEGRVFYRRQDITDWINDQYRAERVTT